MATAIAAERRLARQLALYRLDLDSPVRSDVVRAVLDGSSPGDLRARFGRPVESPRMVEWLLPRTIEDTALVAMAMPEAKPVGVLNANVVGPGVRELAVLVVSPWQRRGVGSSLVELARHLLADALVGTIDGSNVAARRLLAATAVDAQIRATWGEIEFCVEAMPGRRSPVVASLCAREEAPAVGGPDSGGRTVVRGMIARGTSARRPGHRSLPWDAAVQLGSGGATATGWMTDQVRAGGRS